MSSFRVTAKALIFVDNRVLLIRKPDGDWDLPGGRLDAGEDPEKALRREIREEIGVDAELVELADCNVRHSKGGARSVFVVSYLCKTNAKMKDIKLSAEHTEAALHPVSKVASLPMIESYKTAVRRGYEKQRRRDTKDLHPTAAEALMFLFQSRVFNAA